MLDLLFPVSGDGLPTDHAYPLYSALSGAVPAIHDPAVPVRIAPISGESVGAGRLRVNDRSVLRLRVPDERIRDFLPLAGRRLVVGPDAVRLGVPRVAALIPAATLAARIVTLKHNKELSPFLARAAEQLTALGVDGEATVPVIPAGPRAGQPLRRVVRVKGRRVIGYGVVVGGLTAADSIRLQEVGLGGRGRLGCGFFLPARIRG